MADYVHLTIADVIAQVEAELTPRAQVCDTVVYTFLSLSGEIKDRPAIVHEVLPDGTLALTVIGPMNDREGLLAERHGVRHDASGEPGTWRYRGGDWR